MLRHEYAEARRLYRRYGMAGIRTLAYATQVEFSMVADMLPAQDWLEERASIVRCCQRHGLAYTFHNLRHGVRFDGDPMRLAMTDQRAARKIARRNARGLIGQKKNP